MRIEDLKKSISEMSDSEAYDVINRIRETRISGSYIKRLSGSKTKTTTTTTTKTPSKKKHKISLGGITVSLSPEQLKSLLEDIQ